MTAAGWALTMLFEHHVERRVVASLEGDMRQLMAGMSVAPDGTVSLQRRPADPRYDQPFSGAYWQVEASGAVVERSRSLWDETLRLPLDDPLSGLHEHILEGPQHRPLVAVERAVKVDRSSAPATIRFAVAQDRAETIAAVGSFSREIAIMLLLLGTLLLIAFGIAVTVGLLPLSRLRADLAGLRGGDLKRLTGRYPAEVALLVDDLNKLLDTRDLVAERNRQRAADLAHGLKTPITAMTAIADEVAEKGHPEIAGELREYAGSMLRHVERELAFARSVNAPHTAAPTRVKPLVGALVRSLERLARGPALEWSIDVPDALTVQADPTALAEVLGGLLDNARKWATRRVSVRGSLTNGHVRVSVSDDGHGVAEEKLATLTARGLRLDQKQPGSGLGLAIAATIVEELGGSIKFANAPGGGFIAEVDLPATRNQG